METRTDRALQAFAELAITITPTHLIMGEEKRIDEFWNYYSEDGQGMLRVCRELLLELSWLPFVVTARQSIAVITGWGEVSDPVNRKKREWTG